MLLCCLYLVEATMLYYVLYRKSKDVLNPFAISIASMLAGAAVSQLNFSGILASWSGMTHVAVQAFAIVVFIIGVVQKPCRDVDYGYSACQGIINKKFLIASRLFFFGAFSCAIIEWAASDFIVPLFQTSTGGDLKGELVAISGIHYGTVCLPYCLLFSVHELYFLKEKRIETWAYNLFVIVFCLFYALCVEMSRGTLLISVFGVLLLTHARFKINFVRLAQIGVLIMAAMVVFMMVRVQNKDSLIYTALGSYAWWSPIYMYIATCFDNLNTLICSGSPMTIAYATVLKPILDVVNLELNIPMVEYSYSFFNARTMIYYMYHDLGVIGVMVYTAVIYGALAPIYKKAKVDSRYLLLLAALQKSVFMVFFGNYFTGVFCNTFPFIAIFLICQLSEIKIRK